jgi:hypothetical protein
MMKKIMPTFIVGVLLVTTLGTVALSNIDEENNQQPTFTIIDKNNFSTVQIQENNDYLTIILNEKEHSVLSESGRPMVPKVTKTFTFPLGTTISTIEVKMETQTLSLEKKIHPAPQAIPLRKDLASYSHYHEPAFDTVIYQSEELYPDVPYTIHKGAGLYNGEQTLFLQIECFGQYAPAKDIIHLPEGINITIKYQPPQTTRFNEDEYDLLIITNELFSNDLQRLINHKNNIGIRTTLETVENIYPQYNGRDNAEDIKLFIKDAIENWGIEYVLLAGGRNGQTQKWHIPSRRVNNDDGWETGYDSDLYFADIYDSNGNFSCWDPNKNNIFAEWSDKTEDIDIIDYYPNVYVGRLPFRYPFQVAPVVEKIIDYELNADDSWFKTGTVVSGDTFPPSIGGAPGWWEGELETAETVSLLESIGFTMKKLWLSIPGAWEGPQDVIDAINDGSGFVHFAGHSNPSGWGNHPPDDEDHRFVDGIRIWDMKKFTNAGEYPIVVLGGCHSAQFNVTVANIIPDLLKYGLLGYFFTYPYRFFYMEWVPVDLSSKFVLIPESGAIASMGNTGLGYGYINEHWNRGLGGWIEPRFFDVYVNQSIEQLGKIHSQAIIDYLTIIGGVNSAGGQIDRKTIEQWVLLGDPSLKVGGI